MFSVSFAPVNSRIIAYFSMEIAVAPELPTYSGGLGVLAGDTIKAAADLGLPLVAVTLLHRKGYLTQRFDPSGWQHEDAVDWNVEEHLKELPARAVVEIEGNPVHIHAWQWTVQGVKGASVPVFFLDTDLPENQPEHRSLTWHLYGGDRAHRFCQEVVLGIGGVRLLRSLGFHHLTRYHLNEGHAALLGLELLDEQVRSSGGSAISEAHVDSVRDQCVFTTHTPVAAGHDRFPLELASRLLGRTDVEKIKGVFCCDHELNMTYLALNLSHYVNGVAKSHARTSRLMFAEYEVDAITNGVHAATWTSAPFQELFDHYISGWRQDNFSLRFAHSLPDEAVWSAHQKAKENLIGNLNETMQAGLSPETFTIGFARRATSYKRADLLIHDIERLKRIAAHAGRMQVLYGGKAHPNDQEGKRLIQRIIQSADSLQPEIRLVYVSNYDMSQAALMTSGVDLWLNTPLPPMEASGTSGMKAALNGVPSLSILDGWWIEGWIEGQTGWSIGERDDQTDSNQDRWHRDVESLYSKLEHLVLPCFYQNRSRYIEMMRHCISLNGSFFNTQRMVLQYATRAYLV